MILQPVHQRNVIGETTKQAHGRMRVGVDQAGYQGVVRIILFHCGLVAAFCGLRRQDVYYTVFMDRNAVVQQAGVALADGQYPAGVQQGIDGCHAAKIPAVLSTCKRVAIL